MGDEAIYYVCRDCGRVFAKWKDEVPNICGYGFSSCISENFRIANRFDLRGKSKLGLFNTLLACLCNRVVVRWMDDNGETVRYTVAKGTDFPPKSTE